MLSLEQEKYVCAIPRDGDGNKDYSVLDHLLCDDMKTKFQQLFTDSRAWRMRYAGQNPKDFLDGLGINFDHPTVRDAIAVDLVKLDDDCVSNDSIYTAEEHIEWSPMEYERDLLHKNFRIHLVNLEPEWSNLNYEQ